MHYIYPPTRISMTIFSNINQDKARLGYFHFAYDCDDVSEINSNLTGGKCLKFDADEMCNIADFRCCGFILSNIDIVSCNVMLYYITFHIPQSCNFTFYNKVT